MITIHQRVSGWLWNWKTGPGWCRDGVEIRKLYTDGMRVLRVQLQDNGPIPREQADEWRAAGMKVWGAVGHVDGRDPKELAAWLKAERVRLALTGMDCNFEEDVRRMDAESGGQWSITFASEARRLMPTLPMQIDTYFGPAAAMPGINLGAYKANGFRPLIQSYWGNGIWDDPPTHMVEWLGAASPSWPPALIKPVHRVVPPDTGEHAGQLPNWSVVFNDWRESGLKGGSYYYIDGADFELLRWLTRETIKRGCAY